MKRDMDLIRDLLLKIEGGQTAFETAGSEEAEMLGFTSEIGLSPDEAEKLEGHLDLLDQAGFIKIAGQGGDGSYWIDGLTWKGHEFLDTVRDGEIWAKTKEASKKAGTGAVEVLWGIAKEVARSEIRRKLGFDLG